MPESEESIQPSVKAIYIAPDMGKPMHRVSNAMALECRGLDEDRYAKDSGYWQSIGKTPTRDRLVRDVTFMRVEDLVDSGFDASQTRRNVFTEGVEDLQALIGQEFKVGEVVFLGVAECTPCSRPSQLSNIEGFAKQFKEDGKGGIRAAVVTWGTINEGDPITISER